MDFKDFKTNCSQIGSLMGNARGNTPPTQGEIKKLFAILGNNYQELSESQKNTAKDILLKEISYDPLKPSDKILSQLIMIYTYEVYGKTKITKGNSSPQFLEKGSMAEPESIKLLSKTDGINYCKNEEVFTNKWLKGIPDIIIRDEKGKIIKIIEVKTSYDLPSFMMSMYKPELSSNLFEVMGYMDLTGCRDAEIVHCLVDMPEKIMAFEEKRLRERYEWLQLDEDVISERIGKSLSNMEYSILPDAQKIFRRPVTYNKITMKSVKRRSTVAKKWLEDIHDKFTKSIVNLSGIEEHNQDDNV